MGYAFCQGKAAAVRQDKTGYILSDFNHFIPALQPALGEGYASIHFSDSILEQNF
jgi:hypothetical protein